MPDYNLTDLPNDALRRAMTRWFRAHAGTAQIPAAFSRTGNAPTGGAFAQAVRIIERTEGLGIDEGYAGDEVLRALRPYLPHRSPTGLGTGGGGVRARISTLCRWAIAHEPAIHYTQDDVERAEWLDELRRHLHAGGELTPASRPSVPSHADCSSAVVGIFAYAGAPDPCRNAYAVTGFTGDLFDNRPIQRAAARIGDLVVYGDRPGHHVCILLEPGSAADPLLFSHGQEAGPIAVSLSVEGRAQDGRRVRFFTLRDWSAPGIAG